MLGGFGALLGVRALAGVILVFSLAPLSVDDYFRVFHALWWWDNPSFTTSHEWLPGYSYVYGLWIGLTRDTLVGPRLLSLLLHLAGGAVLALDRELPAPTRWLAAVWLLTAPLSLVLGAVPLTETLASLLLLIGITSLTRFLERGKSPSLLLAAAAYLGATMVRYDAWALLPVFSAYALSRPPERYFALVNRVLAFLPWFFPLIWTLLLWAFHGEPFTYLDIVREDHFGAGDLLGSLASPLGAVTLAQVAAALVVLGVGAAALVRGRKALGGLVWEAHSVAALGFVALVVARGDVPSQFPARMLYPLLLFAAVPVARLVVGLVASTRLRLAVGAGAGLLLLGLGLVQARRSPSGVEDEHLRAAEHIGRLVSDGELGSGGHALIERFLPDSAAVLVFANQPDRVHIDAVGGDCPARLLGPLPLICPVEPWSPDVRAVLLRSESIAVDVEERGWRAVRRFGGWTLYLRPPGARSLDDGIAPP